jgi:catechol 2,3-dioxygenase-like lactoylglutathione lyase family enzyme
MPDIYHGDRRLARPSFMRKGSNRDQKWRRAMLGDKEALATLAVKDLKAARKFYEGVLGLKAVGPENPEAVTYKSGTSSVIVYRSQYAGTNQATAINWLVGNDIEKIAEGLKERGVVFEHYDMPGMTRTGDIHAMGEFKTAWFKDPDGNILCLMNM